MPEDHPDKIKARAKYAALHEQSQLSRLLPVPEPELPPDPLSPTPASLWGVGDQEEALSPEVFGEWRQQHSDHRGLRQLADTFKQRGRLLPNLLYDPQRHDRSRRRPDAKQMQKQLRSEPFLTCVDLFGIEVCKSRDGHIFRRLLYLHRQMWSYINRCWIDDWLEGQLLLRFMSIGDGHTYCRFAFVGRRIAKPRKLIFVVPQQVDPSADPATSPLDLIICDLRNSYVSLFSTHMLLAVESRLQCLSVAW